MKQFITLMKQHNCYCLTGAVILLIMKLLARDADADTLRFLLAPVAGLVSLGSGAPFLWEPHAGYVSHDLKFIIAASCSGMNFMIITTGMLLFSFLHRIALHKYLRILWLPVSLLWAYAHTILTNTVRILLAIYLPLYLEKQSLLPALLSPDTLHTLIGTVVYFSSLLILYPLADKEIGRFTLRPSSLQTNHVPTPSGQSAWIPLCWYVSIVLGLPFVSRILRRDFMGFGNYTLIVLGSCLVICAINSLLQMPTTEHRHTNYH